MALRANWKGHLRLSLVSCPIALYSASSLREKVGFNRINRKTGNRLKQQNVDSETGEVVRREDIARGYEVGKGQYLLVELQACRSPANGTGKRERVLAQKRPPERRRGGTTPPGLGG